MSSRSRQVREGSAAMGKPSATTDARFRLDVLKANGPVLVDFYADWCRPCQLLSPLLDQLAAEWAGRLKVVKLDVERNPATYKTYGEMPSWECSPPVARPGRSMHEQGLAIDFTADGDLIRSRSRPAFIWLAANAERFGFYSLPSEPWHWSTTGA